jgi:hypothetical protein
VSYKSLLKFELPPLLNLDFKVNLFHFQVLQHRPNGKILDAFEDVASVLRINIDDQEGTVEDIHKFVNDELRKTNVKNMADDAAKAAQKLFECAAVGRGRGGRYPVSVTALHR